MDEGQGTPNSSRMMLAALCVVAVLLAVVAVNFVHRARKPAATARVVVAEATEEESAVAHVKLRYEPGTRLRRR